MNEDDNLTITEAFRQGYVYSVSRGDSLLWRGVVRTEPTGVFFLSSEKTNFSKISCYWGKECWPTKEQRILAPLMQIPFFPDLDEPRQNGMRRLFGARRNKVIEFFRAAP